MYVTKKILEQINWRTGESPRTNPKPPKFSQPLKKDKETFSLYCSRIPFPSEKEKLHFSKEEF